MIQTREDRPCDVILFGGTGQAKVVRPILEAAGYRVVAVFDDTPGLPSPFPDIPIHVGLEGFRAWRQGREPGDLGFCLSIGNPHGRVRLTLSERLKAEGLRAVQVVHPSAIVEPGAVLGEGCQVLAGAIIGAEARLGRQCIVNTRASVDHESTLSDGAEVGPGAVLCGLVALGVNAWIGAGATVLPRLRIGDDCIVGAGAVVTRSVPDGATVVGVPARVMAR